MITIGKLWKSNRENGPIARGYIRVFEQEIPVVVWRNKSDNPKAPQLTIALDEYKHHGNEKPVEHKQEVKQKGFEDDVPF